MDYRTLMTWYREAQVREIEQSLSAMSVARSSQAKPEKYAQIENEFRSRINELRVGRIETVKENWQSLKKKGR